MNPNFHLTFHIQPSEFKIAYGDSVGFLGSCFSDEMHAKSRFYGFDSFSNPFGTVFHPLAISRFVQECISPSNQERILQFNDLFFSEDAGSKIFAFNSEDLINQLTVARHEWLMNVKEARFLFVTFGTAWGYRSNESGILVANCHKLPGSHFRKELSSVKEVFTDWLRTVEMLKEFNSELNIVFTVSPVRHVRDGLIENNRSKAILIEAVRLLNEMIDSSTYFPSYEIVTDELRDYRFFKEDRVHPTDEAVSYVWERFVHTYCTTETVSIMEKVKQYRLSIQHRTLFEGSAEDKKHKENVVRLEEELKSKYPEVRL